MTDNGQRKVNKDALHKDTLFGIRLDLLICLMLCLITLAVYWQAMHHEFVWDDHDYITQNHHVRDGLTLQSISWSFTSFRAANWHPLTWLSHILDVQLFGTKAGYHHLVNVCLHAINTLLLFLVLRRMTATLWQSALVAALFAIHPLHVESVAWVAERKDVLSTVFWMLTMWGYVRYVERPGIGRYLLVVLFFILGIMAKPMLVTLPLVLLLLDYWPLKRFECGQSGVGRLVVEKLPLFALAAASCAVTYFAQQAGGAVTPFKYIPLTFRAANALVSYIAYMGKMIWPFHLAALYPYPQAIPWWQVAGACLVLVFILFLSLRTIRRHPYIAVGWLWYMGTLVPVIGLVKVGSQSMADRYTYVPLIGLFIIIAWGVSELAARWRHKQKNLFIIALVALAILASATLLQVRYWKNDVTILEHAVQVTPTNYILHTNLGAAFTSKGELNKAAACFSEALRINPKATKAHNGMGSVLTEQGNFSDAVGHFSIALQINPRYAEAHYNLGLVLLNQGRITEAITHFSEALQIKPMFVEAHNNLKKALAIQRNKTLYRR